MTENTLQTERSILNIDRSKWDDLNIASGDCPFLSWDFLALLEASEAVGGNSGWLPLYFRLLQRDQFVAAAVFYIVQTSTGQFTWDDGMDDIARQLGTVWFPKLVGMVPFTPSPVWRVLHRPDEPLTALTLLETVGRMAAQGGFSGLHLQWIDRDFAAQLTHTANSAGAKLPWLRWQRQAYYWKNTGYTDFDSYLAALSKNMRRNIKRERSGLAASGVESVVIPADQAPAHYWQLMADYYRRTNDKFGPWAARYLPDSFWELAPRYLGRMALFSAAFRQNPRSGHAIPADSSVGSPADSTPDCLPADSTAPTADSSAAPKNWTGTDDQPIALALLFQGGRQLWGRYWGCRADIPGLHFEVCYYRPISYAISRGLAGFDPGMGGHHKARRGFEAVLAVSLHQIYEPRLRKIFHTAIAQASLAERNLADELNQDLPFKKHALARPAPDNAQQL